MSASPKRIRYSPLPSNIQPPNRCCQLLCRTLCFLVLALFLFLFYKIVA